MYQDDDILMAEFAEAADAAERAARRGVCPHLSSQGLADGRVRCTSGCGKVFESDDDLYMASDEVIYG